MVKLVNVELPLLIKVIFGEAVSPQIFFSIPVMLKVAASKA